ncbi:flagellar protein FlaG [Natronospira bacteriovora]|uniref:Flagellar protein FlaG n=1 Tax=Natronospira bacteriovora TaxID=3069753 RepID=A0ABU0W3K2_9GAMM|nr:flagellar protein FlaG [Natronospira sp. AB-CW4]MDQ2068483.1 flagellar protein FlaG [Natronospira sp. AB-CW4]
MEPIREAELDSRALEALAERAARELDSAQSLFRPELEFKVDEVSGRTVITVYHPETEEIIRQIPPEEALRLAHLLRELGSNGDLSEISLIRTRA